MADSLFWTRDFKLKWERWFTDKIRWISGLFRAWTLKYTIKKFNLQTNWLRKIIDSDKIFHKFKEPFFNSEACNLFKF